MNEEDIKVVKTFLHDLIEDGFYVLTVRGVQISLETGEDAEFAFNRMSQEDDENWRHRVKEAREGVKRFKQKRKLLAM